MGGETLDAEDIAMFEEDKQPELSISLIRGFVAMVMKHWEMDRNGVWGTVKNHGGRVFVPYTSIYIAETIVEEKNDSKISSLDSGHENTQAQESA